MKVNLMKGKNDFLLVAIIYTLITDTYTIATTKLCINCKSMFSLDVNTQNNKQIGIIGNDMRIKYVRIMGKFFEKCWKE